MGTLKIKFLLVLLVAAMLTPLPTLARTIKIYTYNGKSKKTPDNNNTTDSVPVLGRIYFKTTDTVQVGTQIWSDVVVATGCKKNDYYGGAVSEYKVDCRQNPGYGDLFSWAAVNTYKEQLCPTGWRVPFKEDFVALDIALGGTGSNRQKDNTAIFDKYLNLWGGSCGGYCYIDGKVVIGRGTSMCYWSQSECGTYSSSFLSVHSLISPLGCGYSYLGMSLRCVR